MKVYFILSLILLAPMLPLNVQANDITPLNSTKGLKLTTSNINFPTTTSFVEGDGHDDEALRLLNIDAGLRIQQNLQADNRITSKATIGIIDTKLSPSVWAHLEDTYNVDIDYAFLCDICTTPTLYKTKASFVNAQTWTSPDTHGDAVTGVVAQTAKGSRIIVGNGGFSNGSLSGDKIENFLKYFYNSSNPTIDVLSLSFGYDSLSQNSLNSVKTLYKNLTDAGILLFAATGNGNTTISYPAAFSFIQGVGGIYHSDLPEDVDNVYNSKRYRAINEVRKRVYFIDIANRISKHSFKS